MIARLEINQNFFETDLSNPLDISIPIKSGDNNVNAFFIPPMTYIPFSTGDFTGDVNQGGSCNVFTITINPHGNGTHTETVGHISKEKFPIYKCLTQFFFESLLITIDPVKTGNDRIIMVQQLEEKLKNYCPDALIIRTLPNSETKITRKYSGTNPAYMDERAAKYLMERGVKHLLLDVPSIDKEEDSGKLLAHHAFWNYPQNPRKECTISELVYVHNSIKDGRYLLNLLIASFDNDASPSKPVLYALKEVN